MLQKEDLEIYTKDELVEMFVNLINEMEKTGYESKLAFDKYEIGDSHGYYAALITRVNRIKAIVKVKNNS